MTTQLSVCIPCCGEPPEILQVAIDSAAMQLPARSELLILPNGPEAISAVERVTIPDEATVFPSEERLSITSNWNRCLNASRGALIHILHADDALAAGFYTTILGLAERYPQRSLYITGFGLLGDDPPRTDGGDALLLAGEEAGRFLLTGERHGCGSVVISRHAFQDSGGFRDEYPYGPDEEAYLRYAAAGGLAFDPRPLYRERKHAKQGRIGAWKSPDFVATYLAGRVDGARHFGEAVVRIAEYSTARRVISLAVTLALQSDGASGLRRLRDLAHCYPECSSWPRFRLAKIACRFRGAARVAALRRRLLLQ